MPIHWACGGGYLVLRYLNGKGASDASRVLRGGSWNNKPRNLRSANRNNNTPDNRNNNVGFRAASPPLCQSPVAHGQPERA
ncbi:SUMF1/EgtB/PvdO family nonheme iron enzyme [Thiothrix lacustris]|uniref:SUMF1/EgtB/PvdO family nonheme iron enzyme n=1 Tax=Thiothrix lacustris TaxID=525917 RepID=UPI0027E51DA2|nr:SUMF1/EgtB/PvdO family nonheme iron enzyme [Thiothrix lacustris]WMP17280.1 SUMF1/EgtB/PvdO family nonheme iron enzyme [Thiothrix lacustris]